MMSNVFLENQKTFFEETHSLMTASNHSQHNQEPNYWNVLLKDVVENSSQWEDKIALDFGCGCGRNIKNLLELADFSQVDGCDISSQNAEYSKKYIDEVFGGEGYTHTWENDGATLQPAMDNTYDFIMSHQVFQHISNYKVRYSLLSDMYRVMKPKGILSIHFLDLADAVSYYEDYDNSGGMKNVVVENSDNVISDLKKIGFLNITCETSLDLYGHRPEYYFRGIK
jgi:SAM-dependent methyltransferase